jgi:predicted HicB family RNase H-like nuclease
LARLIKETSQYSGRFVLRIAKSLYRELAEEAETEGVSLNSWVASILVVRNARKETAEILSVVQKFKR